MYHYGATANAFYPVGWKQDYINVSSFPNDAVKVDESVFIEFAGNIPPLINKNCSNKLKIKNGSLFFSM
ncbi:hypothetical protein ABLB90_22600 [Photorhabdus bodei]|uniref:hypothetical protein n=1 Tax=Photorhabdus TaxID=29487 RepID=UPI002B41330B|nr:hypothetical protein [Photorhabdus sp. CRI-LC]